MASNVSKSIPKWLSELGTLLAGSGAIASSIAEQILHHAQAANSVGLGGAAVLVAHIFARAGHDATVAKAEVTTLGAKASEVAPLLDSIAQVPQVATAVHAIDSRVSALEHTTAGADVAKVAAEVVKRLTAAAAAPAPAAAPAVVSAPAAPAEAPATPAA